MPRKRMTQSGAAAQPLVSTPDQAYGLGVDMLQMQRAMPAPQLAGQPIRPGVPASPTGTPGGGSPSAMQSAVGLRDQTGLLTTPTLRPTEAITAGLSRGPGPGPAALAARTGTPAGDSLRRLSDATGDPYFAELARKAGA